MSRIDWYPTPLVLLVALITGPGCTAASHDDAGNDATADAPLELASPEVCASAMNLGATCTATDLGHVCLFPNSRCTCREDTDLQPRWSCEPLDCPVSPPVTGTACSTSGLICNPGFERHCQCVGPELLWNCCSYGVTCPTSSPPENGSPCCIGGSGVACSADTDAGLVTWTCGGGHWSVRTTAPDSGVPDDSGADIVDVEDASSSLDGGG